MLLLTHIHERAPIVVVATHDVSPGREHALDLSILAIDNLIVSLGMDTWSSLYPKIMTGCCLLGTTCSIASDALAPCAEEAFHTVQISVRLGRLLLAFLLAVVHLLMSSLMLNLATVVPESGLSSSSPI